MALELEFAASDEHTGFRLQHLEVYNWGTFHNRVWSLRPEGDNALLTGDIGSGKSTLVDAITTLLVPAQRITYNKAAGAEAKERSLRSYVLGYYKSERSDTGLISRAVGLRDHNSYSVILGHFYNEGFDQHVTLAQVFWIKDQQGQPARFFVVADGALRITDHFADFGSDLTRLRKRLRDTPGVELFDSFPPYSGAFRRRFGIENDQALELFNQTVSMKSVGNLTEFVRSHMLEAFPVEDRIQALITHFDDLNRAHEAVLKAKAQVAHLEPLVARADTYAERCREAEALRACREALRPWFASLKAGLLDRRLDHLHKDLARLEHRIEQLHRQQREQRARRDELKQAIAENGGDRLERIKVELEQKREIRDQRRHRAERYRDLAQQLALPDAADLAVFQDNFQTLTQAQEDAQRERDDLQNRITEAGVALHQQRTHHQELESELTSLRQRRSNIPAAMLGIRDALCQSLDLPVDDLPFVGELLQVHEQETDWEGAIERVLHNFGLSLLVPDAHYARVAEWVDRTHLRGRLVYFRVRETRRSQPQDLHPDSLVRKLSIRPDSVFYGWLEQELARRFDYACCVGMDQFRREQRAITRAGQIKAGGERHEKDDRHRLDDRTRFILGWSNEAKIAALEAQAQTLARQMQALGDRIGGWEQARKASEARRDLIVALSHYRNFHDIDWRPLSTEMAALEAEYAQLARESDMLRALETQLRELEQVMEDTDKALGEAQRECSQAQLRQEQAQAQRDECATLLDATPREARDAYFPRLETMRDEALGEHTLSVESCDNREREMREWLTRHIDNADRSAAGLRDRIIDAMRGYQNAWPLDSREVDVSIEAMGEYRAMLEALKSDDLPRFEARFRQLLQENAINEVAAFQSRLHGQRQTITERIESINRSLREIDYNPNRYITLLAETAADPEIREFQQNLRACTEGAVTGSQDEQYSEAKFLQVKAIIERFRGREGTTDLDRRWTRKVTDVRNWFVFSASERWREDDREHEHYTDSGGKSGGQKEKLAYTVLAASLAYQFGLEWGETRSRSFRFVVIDEAFGRGSDDSARYGLDLFRRLHLQLLIVTPLQKIHIIEPFVASVGFVHSVEGRESMVRNLTIEQYQAEKAARQA
ncbi:ATP-binding protein [Ectothiorhodospira lacustris]|uniref:ATP-binding protein n=1 Tax=Ectothiorhodospira lacustris TaxID=2899127 RepID=UPI001EE7C277|nr:ATP-binding protein [Ectothiorhodospira lacustris]MCG5511360.1 ATP-dependent exonuclease SbcCD, C subunit-like protein [Ectothiorhodospira lacustris]MCG5523146.1 ATP-dependent exonuclease SbcCD, C subunit-like protein [Ectothiorhodospira lacustris]